jgi:hypothetical protein
MADVFDIAVEVVCRRDGFRRWTVLNDRELYERVSPCIVESAKAGGFAKRWADEGGRRGHGKGCVATLSN